MRKIIYSIKDSLSGILSYLSIRSIINYSVGKGRNIRYTEKEARQNFKKHGLDPTDSEVFHQFKTNGFVKIPALDAEMVTRLRTLIEENGIYSFLGNTSRLIDDPLFRGVKPDYKSLDVTAVLDEDSLVKLIPQNIKAIAESHLNMSLGINFVSVYKTFARNLSTYPRSGDYVSFAWHFDNSGYKSIKLMYLLTDVQDIYDGPLELKTSGKRYRTLLPGLGNSRLYFLDVTDPSSVIQFTGSAGSGAMFDPACGHRGGSSVKNDRTVVVIELAPASINKQKKQCGAI
ncbi:hypothetical protein QWJ17_00165 [Betaproteobacteria bacterium LSUCC0117]|nr:hypothetical protein [Betaproteobacteria bacterium LSUCC0117]